MSNLSRNNGQAPHNATTPAHRHTSGAASGNTQEVSSTLPHLSQSLSLPSIHTGNSQHSNSNCDSATSALHRTRSRGGALSSTKSRNRVAHGGRTPSGGTLTGTTPMSMAMVPPTPSSAAARRMQSQVRRRIAMSVGSRSTMAGRSSAGGTAMSASAAARADPRSARGVATSAGVLEVQDADVKELRQRSLRRPDSVARMGHAIKAQMARDRRDRALGRSRHGALSTAGLASRRVSSMAAASAARRHSHRSGVGSREKSGRQRSRTQRSLRQQQQRSQQQQQQHHHHHHHHKDPLTSGHPNSIERLVAVAMRSDDQDREAAFQKLLENAATIALNLKMYGRFKAIDKALAEHAQSTVQFVPADPDVLDSAAHDRHIPGIHDHKSDDDASSDDSDITSAAEHEEQERMFARLLGEDMVRRRAHAIAAATNTPIPSDQDLYIDAASQQVAESRFSPKKVALGPSPMFDSRKPTSGLLDDLSKQTEMLEQALRRRQALTQAAEQAQAQARESISPTRQRKHTVTTVEETDIGVGGRPNQRVSSTTFITSVGGNDDGASHPATPTSTSTSTPTSPSLPPPLPLPTALTNGSGTGHVTKARGLTVAVPGSARRTGRGRSETVGTDATTPDTPIVIGDLSRFMNTPRQDGVGGGAAVPQFSVPVGMPGGGQAEKTKQRRKKRKKSKKRKKKRKKQRRADNAGQRNDVTQSSASKKPAQRNTNALSDIHVFGMMVSGAKRWERSALEYASKKGNFFQNFKRLKESGSLLSMDSPRTAMLLRCEDYGLLPEPLGIRASSKSGHINLNNFGIGNLYASAVAHSTTCAKNDVKMLAMRNNRLDPHGIASVLHQVSCSELQFLDLSENPIGAVGAAALCRVLPACRSLQHLDLERTGLGNHGVTDLCIALRSVPSMIRLILRDNDISGIGLEAIGRLLAWQGKGGLGEAAFDAMLEELCGGATNTRDWTSRTKRMEGSFHHPLSDTRLASSPLLRQRPGDHLIPVHLRETSPLVSMLPPRYGSQKHNGLFRRSSAQMPDAFQSSGSMSVPTEVTKAAAPEERKHHHGHHHSHHHRHHGHHGHHHHHHHRHHRRSDNGEFEFSKAEGLQEVDLAWNTIQGTAGLIFFKALGHNNKLKSLDVSWCSMGNARLPSEAEAPSPTDPVCGLAHWLSTNTSMTHLSISQNHLTENDVPLLQSGLNENHTLLGLHVAGNSMAVDARGFLHTTADMLARSRPAAPALMAAEVGPARGTSTSPTPKVVVPPASILNSKHRRHMPGTTQIDSGHSQTRIINRTGLPGDAPEGRHTAPRAGDTCWICAKWRPFSFKWRPPSSGPIPRRKVMVMTDFDQWEPDALVADEAGIYTVDRMVPFFGFQFRFVVDGVFRAAMDELYKRQPPDVTPDIRFAEERYAKELAVAPPTAPSSTATTPAATASGSGARSPSSGFLSSSVSTPLEGLSEDVADPDVEEVLGSDGYLRPGHFINLVESEKAKARRAERDQMLRHMKLKMERRKARREAKRLAREKRAALRAQRLASRRASLVSEASHAETGPSQSKHEGGSLQTSLSCALPLCMSSLRTYQAQQDQRKVKRAPTSLKAAASLIKFNVSARKAAQTGNATRNKLAQEALELEKASRRMRQAAAAAGMLVGAGRLPTTLMQDLLNSGAAQHLVSVASHTPPTDPILPRTAGAVPGQPRKRWSVADSVFAPLELPTSEHASKAFEIDWKLTKIPRFVKKPDVLGECKRYLKGMYADVMAMFRYYSAFDQVKEPFAMVWGDFTEIMQNCDVADSKTCKLTDLDRMFIATNAKGMRQRHLSRNPDRAFVRFEFMEALMRVAETKFVRSKSVKDHAEAIRAMMGRHILPFAERDNGNVYRRARMFTEEVDMAIKQQLPQLQAVYDTASTKVIGEAPYLEHHPFVNIIQQANLMHAHFNPRECRIIFRMSVALVEDEMRSDRNERMTFAEFLEALCRVADWRDLDGSTSLHQKLPFVLTAVCAKRGTGDSKGDDEEGSPGDDDDWESTSTTPSSASASSWSSSGSSSGSSSDGSASGSDTDSASSSDSDSDSVPEEDVHAVRDVGEL